MQLTIEETWFGLARAISSADGAFTHDEYIAAFKAGEKLLGIPRTQAESPWANYAEVHEEIAQSFSALCQENKEAAELILVGLVHIAQADGEASYPEAELMWRLFHIAGITERQVVEICKRARDLFNSEN